MNKIPGVIILVMLSLNCLYGHNEDGKIILPGSIAYDNIIIAEVKVSGNMLTKNHYITHELDLRVGDTLQTLVIKGERKKGLDVITYYDIVLRFGYAFTSIGTNGFFFGFGMVHDGTRNIILM